MQMPDDSNDTPTTSATGHRGEDGTMTCSEEAQTTDDLERARYYYYLVVVRRVDYSVLLIDSSHGGE